MRDKLTVFAPLGMLGYGFPERSMQLAVERGFDVIAVDAGSIDPGPYYLGAGVPFVSRESVRRDLEGILAAVEETGATLVVGSAGGGGADVHLDWLIDVYRDVCATRGYRFPTVRISSEISGEWLKRQVLAGLTRPLDCEHALTPECVDQAARIVGQMGYEPIIKALELGARVVIAGRAFDPAVMCAKAVMEGFDPGLAVHMGKLLECGAAAARPRHGSDGLIGVIERGSFTIEPPNPEKACTIASVAAHSLYERSDPYHMKFPGGEIDLRDALFEQVSARAVRVTGTRYEKAREYTVKLEGARLVGHRTIALAGVRDPILISKLEEYFANIRARVADRFESDSYHLDIKVYGRDAVLGIWETQQCRPSHEIGLVFSVVADTAAHSAGVLALVRSVALHMNYEGRKGIAGNLAFPFSPSDLSAGPVYEFNIHHLVTVADPCALFEITEVEAATATSRTSMV